MCILKLHQSANLIILSPKSWKWTLHQMRLINIKLHNYLGKLQIYIVIKYLKTIIWNHTHDLNIQITLYWRQMKLYPFYYLIFFFHFSLKKTFYYCNILIQPLPLLCDIPSSPLLQLHFSSASMLYFSSFFFTGSHLQTSPGNYSSIFLHVFSSSAVRLLHEIILGFSRLFFKVAHSSPHQIPPLLLGWC